MLEYIAFVVSCCILVVTNKVLGKAENETPAMRSAITRSTAQKAKPQDKPYQIHDTLIPGFVLRVQPSGKKVWKLIIKRKPQTLGNYPAMTVAQAQAKARRILNGEEVKEPAAMLTLSQYTEKYYRDYVESHHSRPNETFAMLKRFGLDNRDLDQIRVADIEKWRNARLKEGLSAKRVNRVINVLRAALQRAYEWELIQEQPLTRLKPLKVDKGGVIRYLSDAENARLMASLDKSTPWLKTFVVMALNTGLRRGELWNLEWRDVDLRKKMLVVRGKISPGQEGAKSGHTRHIPLNETAVAILKQWRGDIVPMRTLPVFGRHEFKRAWATALKRAKIESFRFHDTRHTFASRLVVAGVPLNHVRELMGHSSMEMTLVYAHLAPHNLQNAVELIG